MRIAQLAWNVLAFLSIGLGVAGIALPLLPTTPFLLLAFWAATKGSPRLANWLYYHPQLGLYLQAWHTQRAVPKRAKLTAVVLLIVSWLTLLLSGASALLLGMLALLFALVGAFILTRPAMQ
ncbi:YbaN family protein [Vreelandella aquamarina]|uniref:YbaN family protein n=1 Tax=Vreelandella aquamarina TaxID=77097 RepID=UPI00384ECEA1